VPLLSFWQGQGSITGNLNRFFGLEVDLRVYRNNLPDPVPISPGNSGPHSTRFTFLFGPHFAYRGIPRVNPFAHVLVGGTHGRSLSLISVPPAGEALTLTGQTAFAAAFGGGLDVKVTRFLWIPVIQADYLRESFTNDVQNNLRLSFGVVFRFGSSAKPGKH